ncbi:MAG: hypothetical protein P8O16_08195 [Algoriphagus sp.]|uniref:hypothetical protein n=1 Tax=Algoriphagus sp. TaxID=1872435 RepID=UPI0026032BC8|nr:hypothetical protein [Algoriphagus sp.]MDG1277245.1 hypothetical protein [Algoriphagus sp.]
MDILRIAILAMLQQKKGIDFSPLEVIQQMYPEDWELFQVDVFLKVKQLYQEGLIEIKSDSEVINLNNDLPYNSKISKPSKLI